MNNALQNFNMGIETYFTVGVVLLAWCILAVATLFYAAWYKRNFININN